MTYRRKWQTCNISCNWPRVAYCNWRGENLVFQVLTPEFWPQNFDDTTRTRTQICKSSTPCADTELDQVSRLGIEDREIDRVIGLQFVGCCSISLERAFNQEKLIDSLEWGGRLDINGRFLWMEIKSLTPLKKLFFAKFRFNTRFSMKKMGWYPWLFFPTVK